MTRRISAAIALTLIGTMAAYAQPQDNHRDKSLPQSNHGPSSPQSRSQPDSHAPTNNVHAGPAVPNRAPAPVASRGGPTGPIPAVGRHTLPHGVAIPAAHHSAPMWNGRSWAIGDMFVLTGFRGPTIANWGDYALPTPRRGTHWIFVDGWYLMVGNRTGHIFSEIPADY